jgi:predicted DNA-binding transcriptional regulator AlpA
MDADYVLTKAASSLILAAEALEKASVGNGKAIKPVGPRRGLSRGEAADYIGVSQTLFDTLVKAGQMPKPLKAMSRVIWDIRALDEAFTDLATEQTENPWN